MFAVSETRGGLFGPLGQLGPRPPRVGLGPSVPTHEICSNFVPSAPLEGFGDQLRGWIGAAQLKTPHA
eukprot:15460923-Alexandrium_andersonii.AAC.1